APTVWSSVVSPSSNYAMADSSATEISNTIYFVGLGSATAGVSVGTVNFFTYSIGAAATSSETVLVPTVSSWQAVISQASQTLQIFYGTGTSLYQLFTTNLGQTFSVAQTVSTSQTALPGLTAIYTGDAVAWISGTASPFNVDFYALSTTSVTNGSPFPVHIISLYIDDNTLGTLIHFDTNASAPGVSGVFDYWLQTEQTITIPEASTWTVNDNFVITTSTDQGIIASFGITAPT
ncbi:MAG: hypothetical protein ACYCPP_07745, partial [Nitrososphaerales archaeon]